MTNLSELLSQYIFLTDRTRLQQYLFEIHERQRAVRMFTLLLCVLGILNFAAWPTDFFYFKSPNVQSAYFLWRSVITIVIGFLIAGYYYSDFIRRYIFATTYTALILILAFSGFLFGSIVSINSPWFYLVYVLPIFTVPFSFQFSVRIITTTLVPLSFLIPFFVSNPPALHYRYLNVIGTLIFSTVIIGILAGHSVFILNRENFFRRRSLQASQQKLEHLASHDQLTDLLNRRKFHEVARDELKRLRRYGNPFSLLMIDLDHFKQVNDTYGHPVGDRVLMKVAEVIENETRSTDHASRYGGEEFCILLTETPMSEAKESAERIRKNIQNLSFQSEEGEEFSVTCSIGVAESGEDCDSFETIVSQADEALYEAKESGRNHVSLFKK